MPVIRFCFKELSAAPVVKFQHQFGVFGPAFRCGYIFDAVVFPQPVGVAEGFDAAFCRNTGAGENDDFFHAAHVYVLLANLLFE